MSEIGWAEERLEPMDLVRSVMPASVALGALAGAGEFSFVGAQLGLPLAFDEALVLGLTSTLLGAALAVVLAVPSAFIAGRFCRWIEDSSRALSLGLLGGALAAWHLWAMGLTLLEHAGRLPSAVAFFAMPLGVVGVVHVNAKYWVRRPRRQEELGVATVGFVPVAACVPALLV